MASTIVAGNITNGGTAVASDSTGILEIKTGTGSGTTALTLDASQNVTAAGNLAASGFTSASTFGFKNRIINGGMTIAQRGTTSLSNGTGSTANYPVDRFAIYGTAATKFTGQQNAGAVTPPSGFINYLGMTSSSAYAVQTTDTFTCYERIEGLNIADLGWGAAGASPVTISFWVRSTGLTYPATLGGCLQNSAANRSYPFSYTINASATWEQKTITIAGDTSGTWLTTNGTGIGLYFNLGSGSTYSGTANSWQAGNFYAPTGAASVVGTSGATLYLTGVQLEKGSTATSFDFRDYGRELIMCQRYYEAIPAQAAGYLNPTGGTVNIAATSFWKVTKRAAPTVAIGTGAITQAGTDSVISYQSTAGSSWYFTSAITGTAEL